MKIRNRAVLGAAVLACLAMGAGAQPPVEAFGSLPFITQPRLSPDGRHFVGIQDLDGKPAAVIYTVNAEPGAQPQIFASSDWLVASAIWAKNDRILMLTKTRKTPPGMADADRFTWYRSISLEIGGQSRWVQIFNNIQDQGNNSSTGALVDKDLDDPDWIYMLLWETGDKTGQLRGAFREFRLNLYRVDVHIGKAEKAMDGSRLGAQWIMDGHGQVTARIDKTIEPLTDHVLLYRGGDWKEVITFDARADKGANVFGLAYDGKSLAYQAASPDGRDTIARLDLDSGKPGATLFADPRYDVTRSLTDEWTGRVIGAAYAKDKWEYVYFDPSRAALQRGIEAVFPGKDAHAVSVTQDGSKAIVAVEAPDMPRTYYFLDRDTHVADKVASEYPALTPADLGTVRPYVYKARDGLEIPGYLTLPPGKTAKNLPMVVLPHDGPDSRDAMGFNWWAQFLANRGYAVFQPNYRGSKGYGHAFTDAGLHEWGLKMQDDISDGVNRLVADGIADPKRICIVGAGYGGYAALAGVTFTPNLYACAASIGGVSNLEHLMQRERGLHGKHSGTVSFWESRIGADEDDARLEATSPALHADQVKVPVLLIHGQHNTSVHISQSEEERDALERAGKKVTYEALESDDLTLAATRIHMLQSLERFLRDNIGN